LKVGAGFSSKINGKTDPLSGARRSAVAEVRLSARARCSRTWRTSVHRAQLAHRWSFCRRIRAVAVNGQSNCGSPRVCQQSSRRKAPEPQAAGVERPCQGSKNSLKSSAFFSWARRLNRFGLLRSRSQTHSSHQGDHRRDLDRRPQDPKPLEQGLAVRLARTQNMERSWIVPA
jgi:hypothetical protein